MNPKPPQCAACSLSTRGQGFARGTGTGTNGVLLLGEALGAREAQMAAPFVGDAGAQLNRTLQRVSSPRTDFRVDNVCRCRPPQNWLENAPWEGDAINCCSTYTEEELARYKPRVVVPMGNVPMSFLLGVKGIEDRRGYVYRCIWRDHSFWVVPTYHPSYILRGYQNLTEVQASDIRRALKVAHEGYKEPESRYVEHPGPSELWDFLLEAEAAARAGKWLAADIETPSSGGATEDEYGQITDTDILRMSLSFEGHYAISIPFTDETFESIRQILELPFEYTVFWNQEFDVPRLRSKGLKIGRILDAMYMWHFLQSDLPKGLGYVATFFTELSEWKSLSQERPEYYSCRDADATIQCAYAIRDLLQKQKRFDSFVRHYVELQPFVERMAASGVLIDGEQQAKFRGEVSGELGRIDDEIQDVVPGHLRPFKARKKVPAAAEIGAAAGPAVEKAVWDCDDNGEWGLRRPFLYSSSKQVISYMRFRCHPVPTHHKTGKETTGAAEIEKLADRYPDDPLYPRILNAREFRKVMGQYIDGYAPGPDGRVRTHFNRKPSTWRFNSERPNVQNVLKRSGLAMEYRKQFVAAPGHVLVELDYKAIEAILTGFYAEDPDYVRASQLGVHAILMSHVLEEPISLEWSDADILAAVRELKRRDPVTYDACKRCVHLSNYGGRARRMRIEYPELFETVAAAQRMQDIYFGTIAKKVKRWQQKVLNEAFQQHYLENVFGYRHWFWDVLHYRGQQLEWGTDAKRALAFLPQSTAAGVMSEALLRVQQSDHPTVRERTHKMLRWTIHDSLVCEIPNDSETLWYLSGIKYCMEAPMAELNGLSLKVEVTAGVNWGEMRDANTVAVPGGRAVS